MMPRRGGVERQPVLLGERHRIEPRQAPVGGIGDDQPAVRRRDDPHRLAAVSLMPAAGEVATSILAPRALESLAE